MEAQPAVVSLFSASSSVPHRTCVCGCCVCVRVALSCCSHQPSLPLPLHTRSLSLPSRVRSLPLRLSPCASVSGVCSALSPATRALAAGFGWGVACCSYALHPSPIPSNALHSPLALALAHHHSLLSVVHYTRRSSTYIRACTTITWGLPAAIAPAFALAPPPSSTEALLVFCVK